MAAVEDEYTARVVSVLWSVYGVSPNKARAAVAHWPGTIKDHFDKKNAAATPAREIAKFEGFVRKQ